MSIETIYSYLVQFFAPVVMFLLIFMLYRPQSWAPKFEHEYKWVGRGLDSGQVSKCLDYRPGLRPIYTGPQAGIIVI